MTARSRRLLVGTFLAVLALWTSGTSAAERSRAQLVDSIHAALEPVIAAGAADGSSLLIDRASLTATLDVEQSAFLGEIAALAKSPLPPLPGPEVKWVQLAGQVMQTAEGETPLPLALLPEPVSRAYEAMSEAMEADVGSRLLIGSGYRSAAYQLFVFISYLKVADYSTEETLRHVSLPSEHSQPARQGIDFVSTGGVDLRYSDPASFEGLAETRWLLEHGADYGFFRSESDAATSPWHWHYEPPAKGQ